MNSNRMTTHIPSDAKIEQLTYKVEERFIFDMEDSVRVHCGNLAFNDFSTSEMNNEEKEKFENCLNNFQKTNLVLAKLFR